MTDIIQTFNESRYTLIVASNFLPGLLLFELLETTTLIKFSTEFKLAFAFVAGFLLTEWFYESISIFYNLYTFLQNNRNDYKKFLTLMSPIRMLRLMASVNRPGKLKEIKQSGHSQSMALNCAMGSIGWLLLFFASVSWFGLFLILFGVTGIVAVKTFVRFLCGEESEWLGLYTYFQGLLIVFIASIIMAYRQESEINFMSSQNGSISIWSIYVLIIGFCFILTASASYLNTIKYALLEFYNNSYTVQKNRGD